MKNTSWVIVLLLLGLLACQTTNTKDVISGPFSHNVLIWLKNPDNEADKSKIESSLKTLIATSQYIRSVHLGVPALTAREVVDNSYSYCLIVTFDSKEAQDKYQVEPAHKKFLEECKSLWERILIYDSINVLNEGD